MSTTKNAKALTSLEQLENGTPSDKIIKLKSVYKTGKTIVQPVKDSLTGWYKGVPRLSDEDKRKLTYWAEPTSKFTLTNGVTFDLNDPIQRDTWEWVKHCSCIAQTEEECQFTSGAEYFIFMENTEAFAKIGKREQKYKAVQYVLEDAPSNYHLRSMLLGVDMTGMSEILVKDFLLDQAELNPAKVLEIYESKDLSLRLLLLKALKKSIIVLDSGGIYRYGNTVLGMTESASLAWMGETDNKHTVEMIEREVSPEYFAAPGVEPVIPGQKQIIKKQ